jgi:hypothetical protein
VRTGVHAVSPSCSVQGHHLASAPHGFSDDVASCGSACATLGIGSSDGKSSSLGRVGLPPAPRSFLRETVSSHHYHLETKKRVVKAKAKSKRIPQLHALSLSLSLSPNPSGRSGGLSRTVPACARGGGGGGGGGGGSSAGGAASVSGEFALVLVVSGEVTQSASPQCPAAAAEVGAAAASRRR